MTPGSPGNQGIQALDVAIHGVGVNHGQVNQYVVGEHDTPEQKLEKAKLNLCAGMRDRAERLVDDAIESSATPSPEALYYRVLSIVSRRSPENLTDEDWHKLRHTLDLLDADEGPYGRAGKVLRDLIQAAVSPAQPAAGPGNRPDAALLLDGLLEDDFRADLKDHLRYVIRGIERDALDVDEEEELAERLAKNRKERVPLFFTPDPVLHAPLPPEEPKIDQGGVLVLSVLGLTGGVALLLAQIPHDLLEGDRDAAVFTLVTGSIALLIGAGQWLTSATRRARRLEWRADPDDKHLSEQVQNPFRRQGARLSAMLIHRKEWREERERLAKERQRTQKAKFRRTVESFVQDRFLEYEPKGSDAAKQWRRYTEAARQDLIDDLTHRHWRTGTPSALDWLIQLRAQEIGGRHLDPPQARLEHKIRRFRLLCAYLGIVLLTVSALRVIPGRNAEAGMLILLLLLVSLAFLRESVIHLARVRAFRSDKRQYEEDLREREAWRLELERARPSDAQMARWYDLDQRRLRREVLAEHRMEHRDILFSFFLVEGVPGCVRAKVRNGPPRYSQYRLTFYVLTSSGVWVSAWNVDFATGEHDGRQDMVFRYDAISSVTVESVGVRFGDSLREIVSVSAEGTARGSADADDLVHHEALRLVLHNGERTTALLENYEQLYDAAQEDREQLRSLALETSGITAGFRILTAMATEGRTWFEQRRQRSYQAFVGAGHPDEEPTLAA